MLRGLTSDAGAVQSPHFFDILIGRERQRAEGAVRGHSRADDKRLPPEAPFLRTRTFGNSKTARNQRDCIRKPKCLQKVEFRAPRGAAPLKPSMRPPCPIPRLRIPRPPWRGPVEAVFD